MAVQGYEMTDRLRRLDALFATKVLGLALQTNALQNDQVPYIVIFPPTVSEIDSRFGTSMYQTLPRFTRSLDAAWEGAVTIGFFNLDYYADTDATSANVEPESGEHGQSGSCAHPAEALVLACLRAVGCTEEELK